MGSGRDREREEEESSRSRVVDEDKETVKRVVEGKAEEEEETAKGTVEGKAEEEMVKEVVETCKYMLEKGNHNHLYHQQPLMIPR